MKKIFGLIIGVASLMVSCSSSDGPDQPPLPPTDDVVISLLGDEVFAYSNGISLDTRTRAAIGNGQIFLDENDNDIPDAYTGKFPHSMNGENGKNEAKYVQKYIEDNPDKAFTGTVPVNYYMISCQGTNSGKINDLYLNDFLTNFKMDNNGHVALVVNLPIESASYTYKTNGNEGNKTVRVDDKWKFYEIEYEGRTGLYLCFDCEYDKNGKKEGGYDGVYNDFIVKILNADSEYNPEKDITEGHVETNWAVNQQKNDKDVVTQYSKLSIHVRDITDIRVVLPIKLEYQCESDDFAIVAKHDAAVEYNNRNNVVEYNFNGNIVKLHVNHNNDNIEIYSEGINQDVIDYLNATYHDGVTFEIWTWMGTMPTIENNTATFETLDTTPLYFLNSINTGGISSDYEFQKPTGYDEPEYVNFKSSNSTYSMSIFKRLPANNTPTE